MKSTSINERVRFLSSSGPDLDTKQARDERTKPAPANLEVPPHRYPSENRLTIGEDDAA